MQKIGPAKNYPKFITILCLLSFIFLNILPFPSYARSPDDFSGKVNRNSEVIVMPVHIRVFTGLNGVLPTSYSSQNGSLRRRQMLINPIWRSSGIQFRVESYEVIRQADGFEKEVAFTSDLDDYYDHYDRDLPGIVIYITGNIVDLNYPDAGLLGYASRIPGCDEGGYDSHYIALNTQWAAFMSFTLAHELGHLLGLDHTTEASVCGLELGPFEDNNLMRAAVINQSATATMTDAQLERARYVARSWLRKWRTAKAGRLGGEYPDYQQAPY